MKKLLLTKPVEELIGDNRGIIRLKLGNIHCCTRPIDAIREIRNGIRNWDDMPRSLQRGFYLCIIETLEEYRGLYFDVMSGNVG